jgi:hypothetical protein
LVSFGYIRGSAALEVVKSVSSRSLPLSILAQSNAQETLHRNTTSTPRTPPEFDLFSPQPTPWWVLCFSVQFIDVYFSTSAEHFQCFLNVYVTYPTTGTLEKRSSWVEETGMMAWKRGPKYNRRV